jgi:hypothetical protein
MTLRGTSDTPRLWWKRPAGAAMMAAGATLVIWAIWGDR